MPFKDPEKNKAYQKTWAQKSRNKQREEGSRRDYFLRSRYGITEQDWNTLFEAQGKRCAICNTDTPQSRVGWHTDHDHDTGSIRGILCEHCNRGLGMFKDDSSNLKKAMDYLGTTQGVLSGDTIKERAIFDPHVERSLFNGMSFGQSYAGYDIRIDQDLTLKPKGFDLASSIEYFNVPLDCVGMVFDKSSHARKGLSLFNTVIEPGWRGYLTLELFNASDEEITIERGSPIAQIIFIAMDQPVEKAYDGKYQDQRRGPQEAIFETPN